MATRFAATQEKDMHFSIRGLYFLNTYIFICISMNQCQPTEKQMMRCIHCMSCCVLIVVYVVHTELHFSLCVYRKARERKRERN